MGKDELFPGFAKCMRMMRKRGAIVREHGYHWLRPHAAEFVPELMTEFRAEQKDHGLRCWLLELIGEARDSRALELMTELLASSDERFRELAVAALRALDTPESRRALFEANASAPPT